MNIEMRIRTRSSNLREHIFQKTTVQQGDTIRIPNSEAVIESVDPERLNANLPIGIITLMISVATGVSTGVIANYIFEHIEGKADTVIIEGEEIENKLEEIKEKLDSLITKLDDRKD